jgi:hypothetical protein
VSSIDPGTVTTSTAGATGTATAGATGTATAGATGTATAGVDPVGGATAATGDVGRLDADLDLPDQPAPPSVSAEGEVSEAIGRDGSSVLRGGGAGVVEREVGGAGSSELEQEAVAASRGGQGGVTNAKYAAGEASFSAVSAPGRKLDQAGSLEIHERRHVVGQAQEVEDAHSEARRIVDDPTAVGTERAEMEASQEVGESMPVDPNRAEAKANVVAGAVDDPRGAAQGHAEGVVSAHEREAEVKVGIRGSAGQSREEIVGSPPTSDDEKK